LGLLAAGLIWVIPAADQGRRASREITRLELEARIARAELAEASQAQTHARSTLASVQEARAELEQSLAESAASIRALEGKLKDLYARLGAVQPRHSINAVVVPAPAPIQVTGPDPVFCGYYDPDAKEFVHC
jgi:septal ring factor EnvC (AmiA/AmiB activator)